MIEMRHGHIRPMTVKNGHGFRHSIMACHPLRRVSHNSSQVSVASVWPSAVCSA